MDDTALLGLAADLARRHGHTLHLRQPEIELAVRQHLALDLASELEFAADPFLFDGGVLMALDIGGHLVERARQLTDLVVGPHRHARPVVTCRDAPDAVAERAQVPREHEGGQAAADGEGDQEEVLLLHGCGTPHTGTEGRGAGPLTRGAAGSCRAGRRAAPRGGAVRRVATSAGRAGGSRSPGVHSRGERPRKLDSVADSDVEP